MCFLNMPDMHALALLTPSSQCKVIKPLHWLEFLKHSCSLGPHDIDAKQGP